MQIRVVSEKYINVENLPRLKELLKELIAGTRAEDGCIEYTFNQDKNDETHFSFIETWRDQAAIDAHGKAEHYTKIIPQINEMCYKKGALYFYTELEI